jgi:predicted GNAT family acetyltransferase
VSRIRAGSGVNNSTIVAGKLTNSERDWREVSVRSITYEDDEARSAVQAVFGRELSSEDLSRLAGAREDDLIEISGGTEYFEINMHSADAERNASFTVYRMDQNIIINNTYVRNSGDAQGAGRDLIAAFDDMKALGVSRMEASAARSEGGRAQGMNGYYTWAKLGFTGEIPDALLPLAEERFGPGITRVEQLMRLGRVGEQWWKEHGDSWDATFSFEDGSYSMRVLNAWRNRIERKIEK